jgi:hypothetical protein
MVGSTADSVMRHGVRSLICHKLSRFSGDLVRRGIMDTTTLLIIIIVLIILFGGGWYGRGRWF